MPRSSPLVLIACVLLCGCDDPPHSAASPAASGQTQQTDHRKIRSALVSGHGQVSQLEGNIRTSRENTWSRNAVAARENVESVRRNVTQLKQESLNVRAAESWLHELDVQLRSAGPENWNRNSAAARNAAGNLRLELEKLERDARRRAR